MNTRSVIAATLALTLTAGSALAQSASDQWNNARLSTQAEAAAGGAAAGGGTAAAGAGAAVAVPGVGAVSAATIAAVGAGVLATGAFISIVSDDDDDTSGTIATN